MAIKLSNDFDVRKFDDNEYFFRDWGIKIGTIKNIAKQLIEYAVHHPKRYNCLPSGHEVIYFNNFVLHLKPRLCITFLSHTVFETGIDKYKLEEEISQELEKLKYLLVFS